MSGIEGRLQTTKNVDMDCENHLKELEWEERKVETRGKR